MGSYIVCHQIVVMFLLMAYGYFIAKKKWLTATGSRQISNILLCCVTPVVIINAFDIAFSVEKVIEILITFATALTMFVMSAMIARAVLGPENRFEQFPAIFANAGFFGIPLVSGLMGSAGVFYLTIIILAYNLCSWVYGIYLISGEKKAFSLKQILTTPAFIGLWIGTVVFVLPWQLPPILSEALQSVEHLNTPLAMFLLGSYVAESPLRAIFSDRRIYKTCLVKLAIIPICSLFFLKCFPMRFDILKMVLLIVSAAPSGVATSMFAQQYKADYIYGAKIVSMSTLFSIVSIPIMLTLSQAIW